MNNNYHLIFIHFPIALLSLYAFLEVLSVSKHFFKKESLELTKGILLVVGVLSGYISESTGEMVQNIISRTNVHLRTTLHFHEMFANLTVGIFLILAISYVISFMESTESIRNSKIYTFIRSKIPALLLTFIFLFEKRSIRITLAILGAIAVMTTGALGGILTNSCMVDPVTVLVCKVFSL